VPVRDQGRAELQALGGAVAELLGQAHLVHVGDAAEQELLAQGVQDVHARAGLHAGVQVPAAVGPVQRSDRALDQVVVHALRAQEAMDIHGGLAHRDLVVADLFGQQA